MPKKSTTVTSTTTRITNMFGDAYFVTKSTLREGVSGGYKLKLADLKQALKGNTTAGFGNNARVPFTHNGIGYTGENSALVFVEKKNGRIFRVSIGCQMFEGKNASTLLRATRSAKPLANAAAAGI